MEIARFLIHVRQREMDPAAAQEARGEHCMRFAGREGPEGPLLPRRQRARRGKGVTEGDRKAGNEVSLPNAADPKEPSRVLTTRSLRLGCAESPTGSGSAGNKPTEKCSPGNLFLGLF